MQNEGSDEEIGDNSARETGRRRTPPALAVDCTGVEFGRWLGGVQWEERDKRLAFFLWEWACSGFCPGLRILVDFARGPPVTPRLHHSMIPFYSRVFLGEAELQRGRVFTAGRVSGDVVVR